MDPQLSPTLTSSAVNDPLDSEHKNPFRHYIFVACME